MANGSSIYVELQCVKDKDRKLEGMSTFQSGINGKLSAAQEQKAGAKADARVTKTRCRN